jgi:hypothetical protein
MKKCISASDAEEGMVLAKPVENEKGMILCAEGTPLTGDIIERFNQMAIPEIYIEHEEELSEEDYITLKQRLEKRFAPAGDRDPLLGKLKRMLLDRLELRKGSQ